MTEQPQAGPEVPLSEIEGHLRAAVDLVKGITDPVEKARATQWLATTFRREVTSLRDAAFQGLLDSGHSIAQSGAAVGMTKGGFQSVLLQARKRARTREP